MRSRPFGFTTAAVFALFGIASTSVGACVRGTPAHAQEASAAPRRSTPLPYAYRAPFRNPKDSPTPWRDEDAIHRFRSVRSDAIGLLYDAQILLEIYGDSEPPEIIPKLVQGFHELDTDAVSLCNQAELSTVTLNLEVRRIGELEGILMRAFESHVAADDRARLHQLGWWKDMLRFGPDRMLDYGELPLALDFDVQQRRRLDDLAQTESKRLADEALRIEREAIDTIIDELDPGTRLRLRRRLGDLDDWDDYGPVLVEKLAQQVSYTRGTWEANRKFAARPSRERDLRLLGANASKLPTTAIEVASHPLLQNVLELDDTQRDAIATSRREIVASLREQDATLVLNDDGKWVADMRRWDELAAGHAQRLEDRILQTLTYRQRRRAGEIADAMLIRRLGLLPLLVVGSLGDEVRLSDTERERLFALGPMLARRIREQNRDQIEACIERFVSELTPERRRTLQASLGEPPTRLPMPDITEYAVRMAGRNRRGGPDEP